MELSRWFNIYGGFLPPHPCGALVTASVTGDSSHQIDVCEGSSSTYTFNASSSSSGSQPMVYQWQLSTDKGATWNDIAGATSFSYLRLPTLSGNYWYRFTEREANTNRSCGVASPAIIINVHTKPTVDAGQDRHLINGNTVLLAGKVEGEGLKYSWGRIFI